jgi:hypothetical protein
LRREVLSEIDLYQMALHRDIFWVGKQWAVTGHGMQAVDQKQKSKFDIEASRLWEDNLLDNLSPQRWFNSEDFNAGLSIARARYPEAPEKAASRKKAAAKESPPAPAAPAKPAPKTEAKPEFKPAGKPQARAESKAEPKVEAKRAELKAEPGNGDAKAKAAIPQAAVAPAKPAAKVEPSKPVTAPPASKLAFTSGPAQSTLKVKARREKKRPPAQLSMSVVGWPAKFTKMWRVRISRK